MVNFKKLKIAVVIGILLTASAVQCQQPGDPGKSSSGKVKTDTLLKAMAPDEKAGQDLHFKSHGKVKYP
jgi:hypothetical protein